MTIKRRVKQIDYSTGRSVFIPQKKDTGGSNLWEAYKDSEGNDINFHSMATCEEFVRSEMVVGVSYKLIT